MIAAGIDFGDQNCVVAVPAAYGVDIVPNQASTRLTPSQVTYSPNRRFAGIFSKQMQAEYINTTFTDLKRLIGLPYNSPERQTIQNIVAFPLSPLPNGLTGIELNYGDGHPIIIPPIQCIGYLLKEISNLALDRNPQINKFIIVVSPWWGPFHRQCLLDAASIAGLNVDLLNSTTAAAISYSLIQRDRLQTKRPVPVCLVDFGNSSLNVAIAMMKPGQVTMISSASDPTLGGSHFTDILFSYLKQKIMTLEKENKKIEPTDFSSQRTLHRLRSEAERIKKCLSVNAVVQCEWNVTFPVKREEFIHLIQPLLDRIPGPIKKVLTTARVKPSELAAAEALGGASRIPAVRETIVKALFIDVAQLGRSLDMDECFAQGAGYYAASIQPHSKVALTVRDISINPIFASFENNLGMQEKIKLFPALATAPCTAEFSMDVKKQAEFTISDDQNNATQQNDRYLLTIQSKLNRPTKVTIKMELTTSLTVRVKNLIGNNGVEVKCEMIKNSEVERLSNVEKKHSEQDLNALAADEALNDLEAALIKVFKIKDKNPEVFSSEMNLRIEEVNDMLKKRDVSNVEKYNQKIKELQNDEKQALLRIAAFKDLFSNIQPIVNDLESILKELKTPLEEAKSLNNQQYLMSLNSIKNEAQALLSEYKDVFNLKQDQDPPEYPFESIKKRVAEIEDREKKLADQIHRDKVFSEPKPKRYSGW